VHTGDVKDVTHWPIRPALIIADPPYGDIVPEAWDKADVNAWIGLFLALYHITDPGVPIYWWGGIGKPKARAFFEFIVRAERETAWRMRDLITWKKKRAYGTEGDYLFTREECAIFVHGEAKGAKGAPPYRRFVKPYLTEKRGYDGFGEHKAHSEYKRRSNVWDETELMSGKLHPCHKAPIVVSIPIEAHTEPGDLVLDLYSGSGETAVQALRLGRHVLSVEQDPDTAERIRERLKCV
jgi:DNA modification methylase